MPGDRFHSITLSAAPRRLLRTQNKYMSEKVWGLDTSNECQFSRVVSAPGSGKRSRNRSTTGEPRVRHQLLSEHGPESLVYDPHYLDVERSDGFIAIQITLNEGRSIEMKKAFYRRVAEDLRRELDVRPQDVFINLVEVKKENWSFGNGIAQYAS